MSRFDAPCAGCGVVLPGTAKSLPAGERRCHSCRRSAWEQRQCSVCGQVFATTSQRRRDTCSEQCACAARVAATPVREWGVCQRCGRNTRPGRDLCHRHTPRPGGRSPSRRIRKEALRHTDVTAEYVERLVAASRNCPLCGVVMVAESHRPDSKEVDHIVPLNVGGTHTVGNLRVICGRCNRRRPKDGSDYEGPVTLFAQVSLDLLPARTRPAARRCSVGHRVEGSGGCVECQRVEAARRGRQERQRQALAMRARGARWQEIAAALGYRNASGAYHAAAAAAARVGSLPG